MRKKSSAPQKVIRPRSLAAWATLAAATAFIALSSPRPISAELGGDVTSVEADREKMEATLLTTSRQLYTIHEMHTANDVIVREFVSQQGKVFGVAWQGPARPDLRQVLGAYFDQFNEAAKSQRTQRAGRGPFAIHKPGFVLEMGGHMRALVGRAYIPAMVPAGVQLEEIR